MFLFGGMLCEKDDEQGHIQTGEHTPDEVLLRRAGERADENGLCKLPTAASPRTDRNLARSTYIFIRTKLSIGQLAEREMARATAWLFLSQGSTHPFSRFTHPFPRFKPSRGYQFLVFGGRRIQPLSTLPSNTRHPSQPIPTSTSE